MLTKLAAFVYALFHTDAVYLTVVRRYVDAQGHFVGELYLGNGRGAKMVGMSCDNLPFSLSEFKCVKANLDCVNDFLAPMSAAAIRVGAMEPAETPAVRNRLAKYRYCYLQITVLNRFVEHVMEEPSARS